ncbi:unnamed protein product [Phaeothamnion confervicola]
MDVSGVSFLIRPLRDSTERQIAFDWARMEGWWPGSHDEQLGAASDPTGWFCGEVDGRIISVVCGMSLAPTLGFIGLYICHPDYRRRGFALPLFHHALRHLGDSRNMALDAVEAQVGNYAKLGFRPEYKTWRLTGNYTSDERAKGGYSGGDSSLIRRLDGGDDAAITALAEFDQRHISGYWRKDFLAALAALPGASAAVLYDESDGDGSGGGSSIRGYTAVRPALDKDGTVAACRIGPLMAVDLPAARALLLWAAASQQEEAGQEMLFAIDVIEHNAAFLEFLEVVGFQKQWGCIRMYTKGPPEGLNLANIYGVSTWELQAA